jgi:hypothetical protein
MMIYPFNLKMAPISQYQKPALLVNSRTVYFKGKVEKDPSLVIYRRNYNEALGDTHHYLAKMQDYFQPLFDWVEQSAHNSLKLRWHADRDSQNRPYEHLVLELPASDPAQNNASRQIPFFSYCVQHSSHSYMLAPFEALALKLPKVDDLLRHLKFFVSFFAPHLSESHKLEEGAKEV